MTQLLKDDNYFMNRALLLAQKAQQIDEVPVGAVIVYNDEIIGEGYNQMISLNDPTAHAEMLAIKAAAQHLGNYRLINTTLYITLEPCCMCAGAIIHSRIFRVVYGASDYKTGAAGSFINLLSREGLNHYPMIESGLMAEESSQMLSHFFKMKRLEKKKLKLIGLKVDYYK